MCDPCSVIYRGSAALMEGRRLVLWTMPARHRCPCFPCAGRCCSSMCSGDCPSVMPAGHGVSHHLCPLTPVAARSRQLNLSARSSATALIATRHRITVRGGATSGKVDDPKPAAHPVAAFFFVAAAFHQPPVWPTPPAPSHRQ